MHHNNPAERSIQTWKDHFLAGLASIHPDFPMTKWDRLINQCNITLNLLRASRIHPHLSAYAGLFGNFDFTKNSSCSSWNSSGVSQLTFPACIMGFSRSRGMVHWSCNGPLSQHHSLFSKIKNRKSN